MPIKVTCSNCGGVLHAPDDAGGKRGRCPTCGNVLPIPADGPKLPAPAADPKASSRSPSFGDFSMGPQVGPPAAPARPTAGSATALPFADDSPASARSSVPSLAEPTVAPRRKPAVAALPAEDRRRPNDPFARKTAAKAEPDAAERIAKRWKKVRGGLWWVRSSIFFFLLPILALNGLKLYELFVGPVPEKDPGYAGVAWLPSSLEFEIVAVIAPFVLAVLLMLIGRLGVAAAPKTSHSRGMALFSALATLLVVCSGIAIVLPIVAMLATGVEIPIVVRNNGVANWQLMLPGDNEGMMQRFGLMLGATAFVVAEVWFASALGRIGTALDSARLAGRATRYLVLLGLIFGGLVATGALAPAYNFGALPKEVSGDTNRLVAQTWTQNAEPQLDKLGQNRAALRAAVFILGGLIIALMYWRMVGAGRGAIRDWQEQHDRS